MSFASRRRSSHSPAPVSQLELGHLRALHLRWKVIEACIRRAEVSATTRGWLVEAWESAAALNNWRSNNVGPTELERPRRWGLRPDRGCAASSIDQCGSAHGLQEKPTSGPWQQVS